MDNSVGANAALHGRKTHTVLNCNALGYPAWEDIVTQWRVLVIMVGRPTTGMFIDIFSRTLNSGHRLWSLRQQRAPRQNLSLFCETSLCPSPIHSPLSCTLGIAHVTTNRTLLHRKAESYWFEHIHTVHCG